MPHFPPSSPPFFSLILSSVSPPFPHALVLMASRPLLIGKTNIVPNLGISRVEMQTSDRLRDILNLSDEDCQDPGIAPLIDNDKPVTIRIDRELVRMICETCDDSEDVKTPDYITNATNVRDAEIQSSNGNVYSVTRALMENRLPIFILRSFHEPVTEPLIRTKLKVGADKALIPANKSYALYDWPVNYKMTLLDLMQIEEHKSSSRIVLRSTVAEHYPIFGFKSDRHAHDSGMSIMMTNAEVVRYSGLDSYTQCGIGFGVTMGHYDKTGQLVEFPKECAYGGPFVSRVLSKTGMIHGMYIEPFEDASKGQSNPSHPTGFYNRLLWYIHLSAETVRATQVIGAISEETFATYFTEQSSEVCINMQWSRERTSSGKKPEAGIELAVSGHAPSLAAFLACSCLPSLLYFCASVSARLRVFNKNPRAYVKFMPQHPYLTTDESKEIQTRLLEWLKHNNTDADEIKERVKQRQKLLVPADELKNIEGQLSSKANRDGDDDDEGDDEVVDEDAIDENEQVLAADDGEQLQTKLDNGGAEADDDNVNEGDEADDNSNDEGDEGEGDEAEQLDASADTAEARVVVAESVVQVEIDSEDEKDHNTLVAIGVTRSRQDVTIGSDGTIDLTKFKSAYHQLKEMDDDELDFVLELLDASLSEDGVLRGAASLKTVLCAMFREMSSERVSVPLCDLALILRPVCASGGYDAVVSLLTDLKKRCKSGCMDEMDCVKRAVGHNFSPMIRVKQDFRVMVPRKF